MPATSSVYDQLFRTIMLAGAAFIVPIAAFYRIRSRTRERLDRQQEGLFLLAGIRLAGLVTIGSLIAFLIEPASMAWSAVAIPLWARWMGVSLAAVATLLWLFTCPRSGLEGPLPAGAWLFRQRRFKLNSKGGYDPLCS